MSSARLLVGAILVFDISAAAQPLRLAAAFRAPRLARGHRPCPASYQRAGHVQRGSDGLRTQSVFIAKIVLIIVGFTNLGLYHWARQRAVLNPPVPPHAHYHAAMSAGIWILAVIAGRSIAYF